MSEVMHVTSHTKTKMCHHCIHLDAGRRSDSSHAKQRQGRPKSVSLVKTRNAVIDTRHRPQVLTRAPPVPLSYSNRLFTPAAHLHVRLKPPTAIWRPPRCPCLRYHSNGGLRIIFCRVNMKSGSKDAGSEPASFELDFIFTRPKMMRSPPFEWKKSADIAGSGRVSRFLGTLGVTRVH